MATNILREHEPSGKPTEADVKLHEIITYGHSTLRVRCGDVTEFGKPLKQFAKEMLATMIENEGVGLAAPQVDRPIRFLVIGIPQEDSDELYTLAVANPEIIESSGMWDFEEGCLSIPDVRETVSRPEFIKMRYQDLDGKEQTIEADGLLARVLQHEIDHTNGILFVDHLSPVRRLRHNGKLKELARENSKQA
ncbi:peptide deformylase [bacterium]|nr:peptide deformylase [bacterium]MBU1637907.1 peptide deformylase [bacterium]RQV94222.1 MAG: peptide deformylase [bacterium]